MNEYAETLEDIQLPEPGKIWLGYQVLAEIGRGGMGVVFKARQSSPQRHVALKILARNGLERSIKRFEREITITAKLNSPSITQLYDFKQTGQFVVLVMEYVDGVPLNVFLENNDISFMERIHIFLDILKAINYAHKQNVIHRDIKPDNILVTRDKKIKIIDFGIARQADRKFDLTKTGDIVGTPQYMAPEQIAGRRANIDEQTDIYALGTVLYEVITGEKMIPDGSVINIFYHIQHQKITSPKAKNPKISSDLHNIWQKSIAHNKKQRYQTIDDFIRDIETFLGGGRVRKHISLKFLVASVIFVIAVPIYFFWLSDSDTFSVENIVSEDQKILESIDQEEYEIALDTYLANPDYRYNYLLNRGIVLCCDKLRQQGIDVFNQGNYQQSEIYLEKVIKIFPHDIISLSYLAKVHYQDMLEVTEVRDLLKYNSSPQVTERLEKAWGYLQQCIKFDPYNGEHFFVSGIIKLTLHQYRDAVINLRKSLTLDKVNMNTLAILYRIPYYAPDLQDECYPYCINSISTAADYNKSIDLFYEVFVKLEKKYTTDYFQLLVSSESKKYQDSFVKILETLPQAEKTSILKNKLLYFKYIENFEEKIKNHCKNFSSGTDEYNFLHDVTTTAREQKEKEYTNFCYYQLSYMYNNNRWQGTQKLGETFQKKLHNIIFCSDKERENTFITFIAIKAYIESYGFIDLVMGLEQDICIINKVLLTATLRSYSIPVRTEVFSLWQQQNYKITAFGDENEFVACMVASSLYKYVTRYKQDTFYRHLDENNGFPILHEYEKNLLYDLAKNDSLKIKTCAIMSIHGWLTSEYYQNRAEGKKIIEQVKSLLKTSPLDIRQYIHSLFWQEVFYILVEPHEYLSIYYSSIEKEQDWRIRRFLVSATSKIAKITDINNGNLKKEITEKSLWYYKRVIEESTQNRTKENVMILMYTISHLGIFDHISYSEIKEYLNSVDCNVFERMFGLITKLQKTLSSRFTAKMGEAIINFWQDVEKETEPHFKGFSIYFFASLGFHQDINEVVKKEPQVLQAILHSLYKDIPIYLEDKQSKKMLRDVPFVTLLIPHKSLLERRNIAQKYWQESADINTRFVALATYIPLIVDEEERNTLFHKGINSKDSQEKKMTALGFRRCIEMDVYNNDEIKFRDITETKPDQFYFRYLRKYIELLQKPENPKQISLWEKWYDYAVKLDSKESLYLLEQALLFYYGKNNPVRAKKILDMALTQTNQHDSMNNFLHYYNVKLFSQNQESSQSFETLVNKDFIHSKLAKISFEKNNYQAALLFYQKMIIAEPVENIGNFYRMLECLLNLQQEQETLVALDITQEIFKRKHRNEKEKEVFSKERFIYDIGKEYPLLYDFVRKQ